MRLRSKLVVLGSAIGVLGLSSFAYAYYNTTSAGNGAAGGDTGVVMSLAATTSADLAPGTNTPVHFTVTNGSPGHQYISTIHLASISADASHSSCTVADFSMPDVIANQDIASGSGIAVTALGTLTMANTAVSQDACKSAVLTLHLSSN